MEPYLRALIEGAITGNKDDFEKLLKYCMRDIIHMAVLHSNVQEAQDIAQEVAIVMYKKISTVDDPERFWKWLSVVVRNISIDYMRPIYKSRDIMEYKDVTEGIQPSMEDMEFLPEEYVVNAEFRSMIMEEINSLPKMQEICLSYYYLREFKRSDIVEVTGYSPTQVSTALHYGKQTLKKLLEQRFGKNFVYSVAPVGTVLTLSRIFAARRDEMVSAQWCEQVCATAISRLGTLKGGAEAASKSSSISTTVVACIIATVAVAGVVFYIFYSDNEQQNTELVPPPVIEQPELDEPPEEAAWEIRTVADMIGEDEAELLAWFIENGTTPEEWDSFGERIGATIDQQSISVQYIYTTYLLEKQNKRLLLAKQESLTGEIRIRYLFGNRDEPEEIMPIIILLFND